MGNRRATTVRKFILLEMLVACAFGLGLAIPFNFLIGMWKHGTGQLGPYKVIVAILFILGSMLLYRATLVALRKREAAFMASKLESPARERMSDRGIPLRDAEMDGAL